jgi:hypothetical protein
MFHLAGQGIFRGFFGAGGSFFVIVIKPNMAYDLAQGSSHRSSGST